MKRRWWKKQPEKKQPEDNNHTEIQGFESLQPGGEEKFSNLPESGAIVREEEVTCPKCGAIFLPFDEMIERDGRIRCGYCSNLFRNPSQ